MFDGQINLFRCPDCDFEGHIDVDLLYHDMQKELVVQYYPFASVDTPGLLRSFTPEGEWRTPLESRGPRYIRRPPHVVFDMYELMRYIIFRDRLSEGSEEA